MKQQGKGVKQTILAVAGAFFALFFAALFAMGVARGNWLAELNRGVVIGGTFAFFALVVAAAALFLHARVNNPRRLELALLLAAFAGYLAAQIYIAFTLKNNFTDYWDFSIVAGAARHWALEGAPLDTNYFDLYPNNAALYLVLCGVFKLADAVGLGDFMLVGSALNIVMIDAALFVMYLLVKKLGGKRQAVFALLLAMLTLPLLLYTPIYYTDTLTLLFPVLTLYLWVLAKEHIEAGRRKKAIWVMALCGFVCALGAMLKITVLIALVAVVIDAVLNSKLKKVALAAAAAVLVFVGVYGALSFMAPRAQAMPPSHGYYYVPKTHWVMMGLRGDGGYYDPDYELTLSVPAPSAMNSCARRSNGA